MQRMPHTINVRKAKAEFSAILEAVANGEEFVITSHGSPKARIVPLEQSEAPISVDFDWLESMPVGRRDADADGYVREERDSRD